MSNINTFATAQQANEVALLERAAADVIAIANALDGLLKLRQGATIVGLPADQYIVTLRNLIADVSTLPTE